jgi:uncharacterized protein
VNNQEVKGKRMKNRCQNRRDFLKTGLAGLAGTAALAGLNLEATERKETKGKIIRRKLGKTGIRLPVVSMGTGDTSDAALVKAALDRGIVLLATSQYYGNGLNERMIGQVVKGRRRDSALVMTSAMADGYDFKNGLFTEASKPQPFLEKFEGSLKRMELEYVDIFLLPFAARRESVFFEPLLKAMEQIKKQGKSRFIGIATHQFEPEAIRAAVETGIYDVVMTAYNFRKKNHAEIREAVEAASKAGMGIIAMKTMAGAFWDKDKKEPINAKAALKWVLQNEHVHTAVPGITAYEQLEMDLSVMKDLALTDAEKSELKLSLGDASNRLYCQQCGQCVGQCRHGMDIPTRMRARLYAYGHGNLSHARETLSLAGDSGIGCVRCASCSVTCAAGFDVKSSMVELGGISGALRG